MTIKRWIGVLVFCLALTGLAGPAWAEITIKCTVARLIHYGFERVTGTATLSGNGQTSTVDIVNGKLVFTIPETGATVVTVSGNDIVDRQFTFSYDSSGNLLLVGPVGETLTPGLRADGAYYFDYYGSNVYVFDYVGDDGILMGFLRYRDWTRTWGNATVWNRSPSDHSRLWRWEATNGQVPGVVRKWIHPDGSYTHVFYPLWQEGIDPDGNYWYTSNQPTPDHFYWRLDIHYNQAFFDTLEAGTHTIQYWFATEPGTRSNFRSETIIVVK